MHLFYFLVILESFSPVEIGEVESKKCHFLFENTRNDLNITTVHARVTLTNCWHRNENLKKTANHFVRYYRQITFHFQCEIFALPNVILTEERSIEIPTSQIPALQEEKISAFTSKLTENTGKNNLLKFYGRQVQIWENSSFRFQNYRRIYNSLTNFLVKFYIFLKLLFQNFSRI